jgi:uncharacterized protein (DUF2342 family)
MHAYVMSNRPLLRYARRAGRALAEQIAALLGLDLDLSDVKEPELLVARVSEDTCTGHPLF